ncbi:MAG: acyl-CoA dehydrogenase [Promethearchaeota archaeon]|nr:MAG: acyl-CoA dehydrogenase [Candidatus Lokiarchaeota archaeon]
MSDECFFYTEEEEKFKEELRPWFEENIKPLVQPAIRGDYSKVREAIKLMGKKDLLGAIHSKEYGGVDKGMAWETIICEEGARINGAIEMTRLVTATLFGTPIAKFATDKARKKYLPKIVSGELLGAIAMTEEVAGSDLARMVTRINKDGDDYIVNGAKRYITNGGQADVLSIYGVLEDMEGDNPRKKITGLLVESDWDGFEVVKEYELSGMEGASNAQLKFTDLRVPAENLLGKEGQGFYILLDELNNERVGMAAACVGHSSAAFDEAMQYSQERVQFKRPIYNFEGVSFRLADAACKIRAGRLLTLEAARYIDAGDEESATQAASIAFAYGTEMEMEATNTAVRTLAGPAITEAYGVISQANRMANVMWTVGGTTDIQKFIIQRELVKRVKS